MFEHQLPDDLLNQVTSLAGSFGRQHFPADGRKSPTGYVVWAIPKVGTDHLLEQIRQVLQNTSCIAYKRLNGWRYPNHCLSNEIVVGVLSDQFDSIRNEWHGSLADYVVVGLQRLHNRFGLDITGVAVLQVEFRLLRQPTEKEAGLLSKGLHEFCPGMSAEELPAFADVDIAQPSSKSGLICLNWYGRHAPRNAQFN